MSTSKGTRSTRAKYSRRKGTSFENKVAKIFTEWSGLKFVRTRGSGSWKKVPGDVCLEREEEVVFPFVIECKKVEFNDLFCTIFEALFRQWWKEAVDGAKVANRRPMLICSRRYFPEVVFIEQAVWSKLKPSCSNVVVRGLFRSNIVGAFLKDFLSAVTFKTMIQRLGGKR